MLANIWAIGRNTVEDSLRRRVLLVFLLLAVVMLGVATWLRYTTLGSRMELLSSSQMYIILIFGALIAITTAVFLIPTEIERRTIYSVLAKPVQRWEFFLGKFLGGSLTAIIMVGVMSLVLMAVIAFFCLLPPPQQVAQSPGHQTTASFAAAMKAQLPPIVGGGLAVAVQLVIVTAIATYLSLFLTATVNFSVTTFIWIVGSLQWVIAALANRNEQGLTIVPWLLKAGYFLTPHFYDLNTIGGLVTPEVPIRMHFVQFTALMGAYSLLYLATVLAAGIISFERKEV